jgi:tetratricopeptide (TPR) repeat protein
VDEDVTGAELPRDARAELRTASKSAADAVARHLVMAGRLIDDEPQRAYQHAAYARRILPRLACVREAAGLCAYAVGHWAEALNDLRAFKRLTGSVEHLPVMADCERGLGRPERALALATGADAARLSEAAAVEMKIVLAGVRRDLGQADAAVVALQGPQLRRDRRDPWSARLFYAYADALLGAGRREEAREWFVAAALTDDDDATDAVERVEEMDGLEPSGAGPLTAAEGSTARGEEQLLLVFEEPPER